MSSNSVTLPDIIMLIQQIPLGSNEIKGGDLNTRFMLRFGYRFTSKRWRVNLNINARQIVIWLKDLLESEPNDIQELDIFDLSNFNHFIETMRKNYGADNDVRELLENPVLENLIDIQN